MKKERSINQPASGSSNGEEGKTSKKTLIMKQVNCGSCEGLVRHRVLDQRCQEVGKLPISKACSSHRPDVFTLATGEEKTNMLIPIAEAMAQMSPNDLQILATLMLAEKSTRRYGYKFYQKVYVRIRGLTTANYMSNFAVGYVLSADKETVRVIGESGTTSMSFMNDKDSTTLYSVKQFNALREQMLEEKAYRDPNLETRVIPIRPSDDTAVKTFDEAVAEGLIRKEKRSERGDLVALVSRLSKGHMRADKPKQGKKKVEESSSGSSVKFKHF